MSNARFKRDFAKLLQRAGDKANTLVRVSAVNVGKGLVEKSPVDTGRFKNNWVYGAGVLNTSTTQAMDKSGATAQGRIATGVATWKPGQSIYITNSLPYSRALEYGLYGKPPGSANGPKTINGYSTQAPGGMVRLTVADFSKTVRDAAAKLK